MALWSTGLPSRAGRPLCPTLSRDRRAELFEEFFKLARRELVSDRGDTARAYLEQRGFAVDAIKTTALGVVPSFALTERALRASGYSADELKASGLFVDGRWAGRLCGAWRNEWGRIGTFWARAVEDAEPDAVRYLYLRGAARANLPPYGLQRGVHELVLVEGFFDHHQLRAHEVKNSAAIGGGATNPRLFERLSHLGIREVTLCFDADDAGRAATARAVENAARAVASPTIFVARPLAKDPDELVREHGIEAWLQLLQSRECGVSWRANDLVADVGSSAAPAARRQALARAGSWLGSLPPRLALEQEDAVTQVAERCGYSSDAALRSFRARFWGFPSPARDLSPSKRLEAAPEL